MVRRGLLLPVLLIIALAAATPVRALEWEHPGGTMSLSGYLQAGAVLACDRHTKDEDPSYTFGLQLSADLGPQASGFIALTGRDDGTVMAPQDGRLFTDPHGVYQDRNPCLNVDEAYIDYYTDRADLRIGIQKFAWGRLDEINPTDNLNPEDLTRATLEEEQTRKIGVPAIKTNLYTDLINAEIAWVPFYVPYRLPTSEERWFPPLLIPPCCIQPRTLTDDIPLTASYRDVERPALTLAHSQLGMRLSRHLAGWDLSASYFRGYDPQPTMRAPTLILIEILNPLAFDYTARAITFPTPSLHRIQVFGLDWSTTIGGLTLRGEWAYADGKYYLRTLSDVLRREASPQREEALMRQVIERYLRSGGSATSQTILVEPQIETQRDSMKYGLGLDYMRGETTLSLQCIQEYIPDYPRYEHLYFNKKGLDTTLTLALRHFLLQNTLELTLAGMYNIEYRHYLVRPSATYRFSERLQGTLGLIVIQGKFEDSLLGQFRDNDQVYAGLKYSF